MTNASIRESRFFLIRHLGYLRHSSLAPVKCQDARNNENVYQCDLKKEEPSEAHELVVAEARQRPADPHEHKD